MLLLHCGRYQYTTAVPLTGATRIFPKIKRCLSISPRPIRSSDEMLADEKRPIRPYRRKKETCRMRFMMLMIPKGYEEAAPGAMPSPKPSPQ
jgi:hypothetical protein